MQAALTCAERGHEVILCEKGDRLGGTLLCEEKVPFKKHMMEYLQLQERNVMKNPRIDVRLNTEVTPESARSMGADAIICSIGAAPVVPAIPGIEKAILGGGRTRATSTGRASGRDHRRGPGGLRAGRLPRHERARGARSWR